MLYKFKSQAAADVIMQQFNGDQMLTIVGKAPSAQGIVTVAQIPAAIAALGISEDDVIKKVMLRETVDGEFTTVQDVAEIALLFAGFNSNALTGQSLVVSHGWFMQ